MNEKESSHFDGKSYVGYKLKISLSREGTEKYAPYRISGLEEAYHFMKDISNHDRERFYAIHLDSQNIVIGVDEVSVGRSITRFYIQGRSSSQPFPIQRQQLFLHTITPAAQSFHQLRIYR